jgi:hypothetical protein
MLLLDGFFRFDVACPGMRNSLRRRWRTVQLPTERPMKIKKSLFAS